MYVHKDNFVHVACSAPEMASEEKNARSGVEERRAGIPEAVFVVSHSASDGVFVCRNMLNIQLVYVTVGRRGCIHARCGQHVCGGGAEKV